MLFSACLLLLLLLLRSYYCCNQVRQGPPVKYRQAVLELRHGGQLPASVLNPIDDGADGDDDEGGADGSGAAAVERVQALWDNRARAGVFLWRNAMRGE